jgi:predicted Rossmann fold flavoprotein
VILESARKPGAKILVAGGGRCNVTHDHVDEGAFAGSSRPAIRRVLRRFDVQATVEFFGEIGVKLKREPTGKLFPDTDKARTVLEALLRAAAAAGVELLHPRRVESVRRDDTGFLVEGPAAGSAAWGALRARRVILATGGCSLPRSGSDGRGYEIARSLGHSVTPRVLPALVPLVLSDGCFLRGLSGLSAQACLQVRSSTGRRLVSFTGPVLCTHFGLSGPAVLDISRYYIDAVLDDQGAHLVINWLADETLDSADALLLGLGRSGPLGALRSRLPERLARALCLESGVDPSEPGSRIPRDRRRALASALTEMRLPVTGHRGFNVAEVTAGGVPLSELHLGTMASRRCDGLSLCGEICDVDGRIGGFNFQWAWASGYVAGVSAGD